MEKTNLENQNIGESRGGKLDTNLSALADSMQFLCLGVPGISRPKKFNVNAWSTPLKSIENQQRRVAREKIYEIEGIDDVVDDSLSNLSDLFPGQNCFEKTSDFIEFYRLNSPEEESNCTPAADTTGPSTCAHPDRSSNESMVAGPAIGVSNSNSPSTRSANDRSFGTDVSDAGVSPTEKNERFAEFEVTNECDSPVEVLMEKTIEVSNSADKSPSKSNGCPSKSPSPTPPSNFHDRESVDVVNETVEVRFKADRFHDAVSVASKDETLSHLRIEKLNSSLKTPHADHGQNLQSDKLARVCDDTNKLMSLCTPIKDLRTRNQSSAPINPFRCENIGSESRKIVFDFPTSLLDVSIGMLESMTTMMAPMESASSAAYFDEQNIASDLVTVTRTPKVIHAQLHQTTSLGRLNALNINKRLVEENEDLKKELDEYERKYDILRGEYESVLKTAYALRTNEMTLKKALQEYEDEIRKACNKYLILKEYASTLIMSLNRSLDQCEEELKIKNNELQKLKGSF